MELSAMPDLHPRPTAFSSVPLSPPTSAATAEAASASCSPLMDVIAALEHAAMSAKRLSSFESTAATADASSAIASLRNAHQVIGSFLAQFEPRLSPGDALGGGDEPMGDGMVAAADADASSDVGEGEGVMRECDLRSKRRRKRLVPPSWLVGRTDDREIGVADPVDRRRSALDLVLQFHG